MQEDQCKKEIRHDDDRSLTQASENASPTEVKGNDERARQLQTWLALRIAREQRHYLESHCNLLDRQSESVLCDLLTQAVDGSEQTQRIHEALMLLQDARTRGGTVEAVREAYVNLHGGFVLDLPSWLEEVEQRLAQLLSENRAEETAERRVALLEEALENAQMDAASAPELLATLHCELADAWRTHPRTDHAQALETAINLCEEALHTYTVTCHPNQYGKVQNNLGNAYGDRIAGERRENLEQTITCYQEALRVHTLEAFPFDYARAQNNLGLAYEHRIVGERRENLEQTIACYQEALHVRTLDALPFYYAEAQNDLGNAYTQRIVGERRENLEQAIACYQEALRVYTVETFPRESRNVHISLAETEAQCDNWCAVQNAYTTALEAEDLLVVLGAGTLGRDAILKEGHDAAIRFGYALHRLGRIDEAAVAIEHGRARGLAEAMAFDAADPAIIVDEERRSRYTGVRTALIKAQADLHAPLPQDLDENTRRSLDLEHTAVYRQAKDAFDTSVSEIRAAHDPADFLNASLDAAATILHATESVGSGHALVYLAATPWGGVAVAALSTHLLGFPAAHFDVLDLPNLTETWVNALIETRLDDGSERLIGGFALAQMNEGFEQVLQHWDGDTFSARAKVLRAACGKTHQESTLVSAAQKAMTYRPFASLAKQPLASLNAKDLSLLSATFDHLFLQRELDRCLEQLGTAVLQPVVAWLCKQGATSLTLIPCEYLAAFPLTALILPDGRLVGETLPTSVAPSARSLLHPIHTRSPQAGVYALGDPHDNLPWSEAEALTLTALARRFALPVEARSKGQATRERLLSALGSRWLVDACCHATFDLHDFLRSALLLTNKGRITMAEMITHQADLRGLRLLLLSACQTAILDLQGARDEVHSLAAAMLQAGAQAVLAAQWVVDDKATYLLMVRFAQEWFPNMERESPAAALARAQVWLRNVTNADLATWHSTMPTPAGMKPLMEVTSKRRQPGKTTSRKPATRWEQIPVRGRSPRHSEEDARLAVRIEAEESDPIVRPYADPYFWAGFQVIGW